VLSELTETHTLKSKLTRMLATYFRRLIMKNKEFILQEVLAIKGLMQLLMKQRNMNQEWTKDEIKEIKKHLKNISKVVPALLIFLLPGGSLLLPFFAEILDRRKTGRPPIQNP
jgi:cob(I)alamin adenosyltransferase